jgi:hypothetical protein
MVDLAYALHQLRTTNFRWREELFDALLNSMKNGGKRAHHDRAACFGKK